MKKNKTLILVVGILLVIVVGVSFAYFLVTTNITGEGSNINLGTGSMPKVEYDAGDRILSKDNIIPRDIISKNFKVTVTPTKDIKEVTYKIFINITENTFVKCTEDNYDEFSNNCELNAEELIFRLKDNNGNIIKTGDLTGRTGNVEIARETKTQDVRTEYEYTIEIEFKDTNKDQNHNINKTFNGIINVEFAEQVITIPDIIAANNPKTEIPNFSSTATTDEGVYSMSDPMYGGTSYYWRGASTTNHVIFANKCWRIVRINGDKSIRLIYNGAVSSGTCTGNGSNSGSIAVTSQAYNPSYNRSEYVGYTFTQGSQRGTTTSSNLKSQTDTWYNNNIGNNSTYAGYVADGKFCNDRNTASGYGWSSQLSSTFYYAGYDRSGEKSASSVTPTLACSNASDVYELKAGAITVDEVVMAGAKWGTANSSYYLYNGQYYWTMSPYIWNGNAAVVFRVDDNGRLFYTIVRGTYGVRPVINLKADTLFAIGGDGTQNNPYVVS